MQNQEEIKCELCEDTGWIDVGEGEEEKCPCQLVTEDEGEITDPWDQER